MFVLTFQGRELPSVKTAIKTLLDFSCSLLLLIQLLRTAECQLKLSFSSIYCNFFSRFIALNVYSWTLKTSGEKFFESFWGEKRKKETWAISPNVEHAFHGHSWEKTTLCVMPVRFGEMLRRFIVISLSLSVAARASRGCGCILHLSLRQRKVLSIPGPLLPLDEHGGVERRRCYIEQSGYTEFLKRMGKKKTLTKLIVSLKLSSFVPRFHLHSIFLSKKKLK